MRALIDYIGSLTMTGGDHDGEPFTVLPWERRFIRGAFAQPGDAALTVARGDGKSALVAGLASAVVDPAGPLHGRRRHVDTFASSFDQGLTVFDDILAFLGERYDLDNRKAWRKQHTANRAWLEHKPSGARARVLGSDPKRAHGLRSWLALLDEPAQWDPAKRDRMLAAIRTGLGTRPANDAHFFARMLKGSAGYVQVHAASPTDPPFRLSTWRKANPSLNHLPSLRARIEQEAKDARLDPDMLATFKALRLNMGVGDVVEAVLLDAETWARIETADIIERAGGYALGIDAGQTAAFSAASAFWPQSGALDSFAVVPAEPSLSARGLADGVGNLYVRMEGRDELVTAGRYVSDLAGLLRMALQRWGRPAVIVCDRWREGELREKLAEAEFPVVPLVIRGQGFKDGGEDVRTFRRVCANADVRPPVSLLLRHAIGGARVVPDPAGNWKLAKDAQGGRRSRHRDDAAAATILAVAEGWRRRGQLRRVEGRPRMRVTVV